MMNRPLGIGLLVSATFLVGACTMPNPDYQGGPSLPGECRQGVELQETYQNFEQPDKLDILFVVSQSDDMRLFQFAMAEALPPFLLGLEDEGFDIHFAVQTADITAADELAPVVRSVNDSAFSYCSANQSQIARSGTNDWARLGACNVIQGVNPQDRRIRPLEVLERSLLSDSGALQDFRREESKLLVVIFSNEDDCTGPETLRFADQGTLRDRCVWQRDVLRPVAPLAEELKSLAVLPEGFSLAVIAGPTTIVEYDRPETVRPVCRSTPGSSFPSPRLTEASRAFGEEGLFLSSCVLDYHNHLDQIGDRFLRPARLTICPEEPMTQEPLELWATFEDQNERALRFGRDFIFKGPTERCESGEIELLRRATIGLRRLDLRYCG